MSSTPPTKPTPEDLRVATQLIASALAVCGSPEPLTRLPLVFDHKTTAAMLSINVRTLDRLVNRGLLKPLNVTYRGRYYSQQSVLDYIARCTPAPQESPAP